MIQWAFILFIATLISTPFALGNVRPDVAGVAQGLFALLLVLFLATAGEALRRWRRGEEGRRG